MSRLIGILILAASAAAADIDLPKVLDGIERRYNRARTIEVPFEQTYSVSGRPRRTESGVLYLRKPGRMRWEYQRPAGKLFISDGKKIYFYSPNVSRVEVTPVKETDDMRAPLGFLLGRLDFRRDFREFRLRPEGEDLYVAAIPKNKNAPYKQVDFLVTPDYRIKRLLIHSQDASVVEFRFGEEKLNQQFADRMFTFQAPPGVEVVQSSNGK